MFLNGNLALWNIISYIGRKTMQFRLQVAMIHFSIDSDPANMLYGGGGYIDLTVEKLPSGDLKIYELPWINMTVEDMFDFNYWNDGPGYPAAASVQCAYGHKGTGVGQVALLRFDVVGDVKDIGDIIITQP